MALALEFASRAVIIRVTRTFTRIGIARAVLAVAEERTSLIHRGRIFRDWRGVECQWTGSRALPRRRLHAREHSLPYRDAILVMRLAWKFHCDCICRIAGIRSQKLNSRVGHRATLIVS